MRPAPESAQTTDRKATADPHRRRVLAGLLGSAVAGLGRASATQKNPGGKIHDVAIVGAGVFGCWTAWHLAERGLSVALVDAFGPGNGLSSSGGETRVTRMAYGPDALYTRLATQSLGQWQALHRRWRERTGAPLFYPTGVLWLSGHRNAYFDNSLDTLNKLAVPVRVFADKNRLRQAFPQFDYAGINTGFLEPRSGALAARLSVNAVAGEAQRKGVRLWQARASRPIPTRINGTAGLRVPLRGQEDLLARQVVYACGAWLPKVFPDLLGGRIVPSRQEVFYLNLKAVSESLAQRYAPVRFPVWADFNDGDVFYGIPDVAGYGFKIAHDKHGPRMDPDRANRRASAVAEAEMRAYLRKRFPDVANAPLASVRVCQYENTSNGDFLLDRHPTLENVWLAGGGSGHGFKHGPAVGQYVADLVTGKRTRTHSRFALETKGTAQNRQVI